MSTVGTDTARKAPNLIVPFRPHFRGRALQKVCKKQGSHPTSCSRRWLHQNLLPKDLSQLSLARTLPFQVLPWCPRNLCRLWSCCCGCGWCCCCWFAMVVLVEQPAQEEDPSLPPAHNPGNSPFSFRLLVNKLFRLPQHPPDMTLNLLKLLVFGIRERFSLLPFSHLSFSPKLRHNTLPPCSGVLLCNFSAHCSWAQGAAIKHSISAIHAIMRTVRRTWKNLFEAFAGVAAWYPELHEESLLFVGLYFHRAGTFPSLGWSWVWRDSNSNWGHIADSSVFGSKHFLWKSKTQLKSVFASPPDLLQESLEPFRPECPRERPTRCLRRPNGPGLRQKEKGVSDTAVTPSEHFLDTPEPGILPETLRGALSQTTPFLGTLSGTLRPRDSCSRLGGLQNQRSSAQFATTLAIWFHEHLHVTVIIISSDNHADDNGQKTQNSPAYMPESYV